MNYFGNHLHPFAFGACTQYLIPTRNSPTAGVHKCTMSNETDITLPRPCGSVIPHWRVLPHKSWGSYFAQLVCMFTCYALLISLPMLQYNAESRLRVLFYPVSTTTLDVNTLQLRAFFNPSLCCSVNNQQKRKKTIIKRI